jgi:Tfp pilus assembly protein PilV
MACSRQHKTVGGRGGFTLAEVLICSVIILLGFMAMMAAFGTASVSVQRGEDATVATFLADAVRDWALQRPFDDVLANNVPFPGIMSTGWSVVVVVTPKLATDLTSDVAVDVDVATAARMTVDVRVNNACNIKRSVVKQAYYIFKLDPGTFMDG